MSSRRRFETGLADRLGHQFPRRDPDWICDETAAFIDANPGKIASPSAYLLSAFKRAEKDDTHRRGMRPKPEAPRSREFQVQTVKNDPNWDAFCLEILNALVVRVGNGRCEDGMKPPDIARVVRLRADEFSYNPDLRDRIIPQWLARLDAYGADWPFQPKRERAWRGGKLIVVRETVWTHDRRLIEFDEHGELMQGATSQSGGEVGGSTNSAGAEVVSP